MPLDIQHISHSHDGINLVEQGRSAAGEPITLDRRLYMQLLAFSGPVDASTLIAALNELNAGGVLYADLNDPNGYGLLTFSENPDDFITRWRPFFTRPPFSSLTIRSEYTMFGRTYAIGYEQDLVRTLLTRPMQQICRPDLPWAVWYPVRRAGSFEQLPGDEQRTILMEHGGVGRAYGEAGLAHDIRLACYGLDKNDNDFVIGLLGPELLPLSRIVERMRKTRQTAEFLVNLGPFFIGRSLWQSPLELAGVS